MASIHSFGLVNITNARRPSEKIRLENLWVDSPCVLFFLRRLGCAICRSYIKLIESYREEYEKKGMRVVALSFEALGEGSDSDRSFEAGNFWNGQLYTIDKSVYEGLFGRKGLMDGFYGLMDIDKDAMKRAKGTPGNLKGDGFQLGGQFVLAMGGRVILDHRQKKYGGDVSPEGIMRAIDFCLQHTS